MKQSPSTLVLRIALAIGFFIDGVVGMVCALAPQLVEPLFDIPLKDATIAQIAGGEFIVVAFLYAFAFSDPERFRPLLWLCALDQFFAVILPVAALVHGIFPPTWKVIAPIPLSALLVLVFVVYAARPGRNRNATPFMQ